MTDHLENAIKKLRLDRSTWEIVKFGDVAIQQKKSVDRDTSGITKYVKGEHMYSEDLHLREWGELEDEYLGPAFIRLFDEGDILYGSRRTYLRKVTIAPFEGITSNTTFVIKANEKKIDQRLLPFVMLSEGYAEHSIKNSKGSVNPYVNWKDLANYEFLLPPKEQQTELVELLWAMDEVIEKDLLLLDKLSVDSKVLFHDSIYEKSEGVDPHCGRFKSKYPVKLLGELLEDLQYGISESLAEDGVGTPILRMNNLINGEIDYTDLKHYEFSGDNLNKYKLNKGDVLFNRTNSFELVGKVSIFDSEEVYSFASYLIRLVTNRKKLNPYFLNYYLNTSIGVAKIRKYRTPGVSQSNINAQNIRNVLIPQPPVDVQYDIMNKVKMFKKAEADLVLKTQKTKALQKSIINEIF